MIELEVCINADDLSNLASQVQSARQGGAARIELCSGMNVGGLTPPIEAINIARDAFADISGLMVMVRPRDGDFCYVDAEIEHMLNSINAAAQAGADGIVLGVLNKTDGVDLDALQLLVDACRRNHLEVTFHRAFDALENPISGIKLIELQGVDRLLTAGSAWNSNRGVLEGLDKLQTYLNQTNGRMELVVGGGINVKNLPVLIQKLPIESRRISFHSYSAVLTDGYVDSGKVAKFYRIINGLETMT